MVEDHLKDTKKWIMAKSREGSLSGEQCDTQVYTWKREIFKRTCVFSVRWGERGKHSVAVEVESG